MMGAGKEVKNCSEGMVFRPTGSFRPGSTEGEPDEKPPNFDITISEHCVDVHEFTYGDLARVRADFARMIENTKKLCNTGGGTLNFRYVCRVLDVASVSVDDLPKLPEGRNLDMPLPVNWYQADKLCRLQGKRLPTEMEWEFDAIGNSGAKYAVWGWSTGLNSALAVYGSGHFAEVCSKPKTPIGLCDMTGNMLEWVSDWYREDEYSRMGSHDPTGPDKGDVRVLRGGSWRSYYGYLRAADRYCVIPGASDSLIGFRCASSTSAP